MTRLSRCFKSLKSAGFLHIKENGQMELLEQGKIYAELLRHQWRDLRPLAVYLGSLYKAPPNSRFSFVQTQDFKANFLKLQQQHPRKAKCPALIKHECVSSTKNQLITDFLVEPKRAREHFYNMQRESKIWWMRSSSNPSRYALKPCEGEDKDTTQGQGIDIRSTFNEQMEVTVEELSLVELNQKEFEMPHGRTGVNLKPTVIRSVVPLEQAACALILDGCDHGREAQSLLLNRRLAPYQCGLVCFHEEGGAAADDLSELHQHLHYKLQKAGLRLSPSLDSNFVQDSSQLDLYVDQTDRLGVPYTLLLDQRTLQNGLLQLRSRDTRLQETIHISDIPNYLLNIFKN